MAQVLAASSFNQMKILRALALIVQNLLVDHGIIGYFLHKRGKQKMAPQVNQQLACGLIEKTELFKTDKKNTIALRF